MLFTDIVGQSDLKRSLIDSARQNRISHALLFHGAEGFGGLPAAIAFSSYLFCSNPQEMDACGKCSSCQKISKFSHPDLHFSFPVVSTKKENISKEFLPEWRKALSENPYITINQWLLFLEGDNKQGNISAAECQDIVKKLSLKAYEGGKKVLIMWLPEYLGKEGNVLLKILEEPPENTVFLLVSENPSALLPTITSRCQVVKIKPIERGELKDVLATKHSLDELTAHSISGAAGGSYSAALALLSGNEMSERFGPVFLNWLRYCYNFPATAKDVMEWIETFVQQGREVQKAFLSFSLYIFRESLMLNLNENELLRFTADEKDSFFNFSKHVSPEKALRFTELFNEAYYHLERNANPKILFLDMSFSLHKVLRNK